MRFLQFTYTPFEGENEKLTVGTSQTDCTTTDTLNHIYVYPQCTSACVLGLCNTEAFLILTELCVGGRSVAMQMYSVCVSCIYVCIHVSVGDPIILLIKPTNTSKRPNTPQMWVPGTIPGLVSDKAHLVYKQQPSHSPPSLQSPSPALSISSHRFIFSKWFDSSTRYSLVH